MVEDPTAGNASTQSAHKKHLQSAVNGILSPYTQMPPFILFPFN